MIPAGKAKSIVILVVEQADFSSEEIYWYLHN
jgi:hypothetical protein